MLVLGLDASCAGMGVALVEDGEPVGAIALRGPARAGGRLLPLVAQLLAAAGRSQTSLGGVAATVGPGSYSGVRAAVATAQGLGLALGLPLVAVGSLEALALASGPRDTVVAACIDARRGRVYGAVFPPQAPQSEPAAVPVLAVAADWLAQLPSPVYLTGPAVANLPWLPPTARVAPVAARAVDPVIVALLGYERLARGGGVSAADLRPVYVSQPEIAPPRARDALQGTAGDRR